MFEMTTPEDDMIDPIAVPHARPVYRLPHAGSMLVIIVLSLASWGLVVAIIAAMVRLFQ